MQDYGGYGGDDNKIQSLQYDTLERVFLDKDLPEKVQYLEDFLQQDNQKTRFIKKWPGLEQLVRDYYKCREQVRKIQELYTVKKDISNELKSPLKPKKEAKPTRDKTNFNPAGKKKSERI